MLRNKIAACTAVFVMLLLWSWQTDQKIRNHHYTESFHLPKENGLVVHAHHLDHSHFTFYTFRPREYVKIIRNRRE